MGPQRRVATSKASRNPRDRPRTSGPRRLSRLTDSSIKSLTPRAERYEVTDPASPGLQVRIEASGAKHWILRFYWRGKRQRMVLGTYGAYPAMSLSSAREEAGKARQLLERGIDPRQAERMTAARRRVPVAGDGEAKENRHSVANLASEFMERHVQPHRKRPEYVQRIIDSDVLPNWSRRDARTITPREVVELLDGIVARGSRVMANREANVLSQMFRFGIHRQLVDDSPVKLLYKPGGKEKPRDRALSDGELTALLANLDEVMDVRSARLAHAVRILLLTGQRRGELALARWRDLDLEGKDPTWTIPAENSKTGEAHTVPLGPWAVREFRALQKLADRSAHVLPDNAGKTAANAKLITRGVARYRKALEQSGIAPFTPHDLRRTCRTGLAQLGIADEVAERVLSHVPEGMRGVYNRHRYADEMRAALLKWEQHLAGLRNVSAAA